MPYVAPDDHCREMSIEAFGLHDFLVRMFSPVRIYGVMRADKRGVRLYILFIKNLEPPWVI
jgi:hypothetical protein